MKKTLPLLFSGLFLCVIISSWCGTATAQSVTYRLTCKGTAIEYPLTWRSDTSGRDGTTFILQAPVNHAVETHRPELRLIIRPLPEGVSMEQYMNATVKELAGSMLGFEMIRTEQRRDHWFIAFTGKQGKRNFQRSQRYYFQQGIVYLLSYTSSRGQPPAHLQEAEVIQDSFRLISP